MKKILVLIIVIGHLVYQTSGQSNFIGSGIALEFTGATNDQINLGNVYNTLQYPLTFEAWINPTAFESPYSGLFASDNSGTGSYYGFYIRLNSIGKLVIETGTGSGSGIISRGGRITTTSVPLNEWTHIAVVAHDVFDIDFYFNGVLQSDTESDGTGSPTSINHNGNPAAIGRYITPFDEHNFIGQMDEIRLWDTAVSETQIRTNMCRKLSGDEYGLIGYWKVDDLYTSTILADYSASGVSGTLLGDVARVTSGAPIGDQSVFVYTNTWDGISLELNSPGGDKMRIGGIKNIPFGIHLYRVDNYPYFIDNLGSNYTSYYYGVFDADDILDAKYHFRYSYSFSNGVVNAINEPNSKLYYKYDDSEESWTPLIASLDIMMNAIIKRNVVDRKEFIFSINEPNHTKTTD